jgi:uroporphyrinogen III methyltransferase/synthase
MNEAEPLKRRRIAVTRPLAQARRLAEGLRELGAEPLSCPTIRIADPADPAPLQRAVEGLDEYDWIVFTSANGVERFWRELELQSRPGMPGGTRVAAIGPATAETLKMRGVSPEVVPEEFVAEAVADALIAVGGLAGRRILLPRAAGARRVLPERLGAAGAQVDEVIAYESKPDLDGIARLQAAIEADEVDMVTFTAASTVRHFVETSGTEMGRAGVAAIGPITARAARAAGLRVDAEAREYTVEGLLKAILEYYSDVQERG